MHSLLVGHICNISFRLGQISKVNSLSDKVAIFLGGTFPSFSNPSAPPLGHKHYGQNQLQAHILFIQEYASWLNWLWQKLFQLFL